MIKSESGGYINHFSLLIMDGAMPVKVAPARRDRGR
jgi:hypothetical protein